MIAALIMKVVLFAPISLYDLKMSSTPRPYALMELSIILCGCCFIIGWYLTTKRVDNLIKHQYESDITCYKAKGVNKVDWMLVVDNKLRFIFKSLYWYSIAYLHSLFIFAFILIMTYCLIICIRGLPVIILAIKAADLIEVEYEPPFKTSIKHKYTERHPVWIDPPFESPTTDDVANEIPKDINYKEKGTYRIPGIFGMNGIFVFFKREFLMLHAVVFIVGFIFFYINCCVFLKVENSEVSIAIIQTNRERFKFLLYISYIFIDSCYMFFVLVMMLYFECPKTLEKTMIDLKAARLKENLTLIFLMNKNPGANPDILKRMTELKNETYTLGKDGSTYKLFMKLIKTKDIFTLVDRRKISSLISSMPGRDKLCEDICKPIDL